MIRFLSDVPGYLSRYEELLKYLIENGGVLEKEDFNAISKKWRYTSYKKW